MTEEPSPHKPLDSTYASAALQEIQNAVKGNGIKVTDVSLKSLEGALLIFTATTAVHLQHEMTEKTMPGKHKGANLFESKTLALQAIEKYVPEIMQDAAQREQIKSFLLEREDKAFGLQNKKIEMAFLGKEFTVHENCQPCAGKGSVPCERCRGDGYEMCPRCSADGLQTCFDCNGAGRMNSAQGSVQCSRCFGKGQLACTLCQKRRKIQCSVCKTKGRIGCKRCGEQGSLSAIMTVRMHAYCNFTADQQGVPPNAAVVIQHAPGDLIYQADIAYKPGTMPAGQDQAAHISIDYTVAVPQAEAIFALKDKDVPAYLFGKAGTIKKCESFLDGLMKPGIRALESAAQGGGLPDLKAAARYKTIRLAINAAAKLSPKKALQAVLKRTPLGLGEATARKLVTDARASFAGVTRKQQQIAVIAGAGICAALVALYSLSPLRPFVLGHIHNPALHLVADGGAVALGALIGYFIWQTLSLRARQNVLKDLGS